jgi:hypothetical protein
MSLGALGDCASDREVTVGGVDLNAAWATDLIALLDRHVRVHGP